MNDLPHISQSERSAIISECSELIAAYAYHVDRRQYAELTDLFTLDGVLERPHLTVAGKDNILAAMQQRTEGTATRHMNGTPHFEYVTSEKARAVTYMIMYIVEGSDEGPNEVPGTAGMGEFHDEFQRTPDGWKIAKRAAKSAMIVKR